VSSDTNTCVVAVDERFACTDIGFSTPLYVWWGDCTKTLPEG